jgi:hypothetical protein
LNSQFTINEVIVYLGGMLSIILSSAYCYRYRKGHIEFVHYFEIISTSFGIVGGGVMALSLVNPEIKTHLKGIDIYIMFGGAAVVHESVKVLRRLFYGEK